MKTQTATTQKARKACYIVRRYFIKRTGSVCCIVRNAQGREHTTCVHANGRTSCTCDARYGKCYHRDHVIAKEAERTAPAAAQTPVATPVTVQPIVATTEHAHSTAQKAAQRATPVIAAPAVEKYLPLNGNKPFSLLRTA